jgi:hypothetical protein
MCHIVDVSISWNTQERKVEAMQHTSWTFHKFSYSVQEMYKIKCQNASYTGYYWKVTKPLKKNNNNRTQQSKTCLKYIPWD